MSIGSVAQRHATIPLVGRRGSWRGYVKVDLEDVPALSCFEWRRFIDKYGRQYAYRRDESGRRVWMHRQILGLAPYEEDAHEGDHANRNTLDNRRSNLRIVSHAQNMQNRASHKGSTSEFRGVYRNVHETRWRAQAVIDGHTYKLGTHATQLAAANVVTEFRRRNMPFSSDAVAASG